MSPQRTTSGDFRIRITYLLPLFVGILLLIPALVPHIFFYQSGSFSATVNLFDLLGYIRTESSNVLRASGSVESSVYYFALLMSVLVAVSWFFIVWYAVFTVSSAAISIWAFGMKPSKSLNTAKRVYRMIVPNRVFYGIFCFLPLLPACLPQLYGAFLRRILSDSTRVYFYGAPDWVYALTGGIVCALSFFLLLRAQKEQKMDLFRIYRI